MIWYRGLENFIRAQMPLAPKTSYRVGGPAEFFCEPPSEALLVETLNRARQEGLPVRVLGHGSNLLVADEGVRGVVIRLPRTGFVELEQERDCVRLGASYSLSGLVKWSTAHGLSGLEGLAGVPGTVGAALRMNAGGRHGEVGACVAAVHGYELDGSPFRLDRQACGFGYRHSNLEGRLVTRCEMKLEEGDPLQSRARAQAILAEKMATQPLAVRSAGCVFKNPSELNAPPAGKLIEELGLKGHRVNGAYVSPKHANFLVCGEGARAADVAVLIRHIRTRALAERGVHLELEIEVWGIPEEALAA